MPEPVVSKLGGLAYRESLPDADVRGEVLLVHGYPQSSYMWRSVLVALSDAGFRAVAPDLPGSGDSPPRRPGTWERHIEALESFRVAAELERPALVVHDWGGLIGLRWACEHPDDVCALVISDTGFFPDGKWHGLARTLRTDGQGEELMASLTPAGFEEIMRQSAPRADPDAIAEYAKAHSDGERRASVLDLYRSGDFGKLASYDGALTELGVPTLILWGEHDDFAPLASAHRFAREIPHAQLVIVDGAGHFLFDEEPERAAQEVTSFLRASLDLA
jgi:haloalkane dehalogenase